MTDKQFCVLPYIKIPNTLDIGSFTLWRSTPTNWMKYFGEDNTNFLTMYVDNKGVPITASTIVTPQAPLEFNEWQSFVALLLKSHLKTPSCGRG